MKVLKRNGNLVEFDKDKIITAINAAFIDVDGELYETDTAKDIADDIYDIFSTKPVQLTVEEIQDLIEDYLMRSERRDVARAYIRYRYKREVAREKKDDFMNAISEKLEASNVQNQNANVDEYSFGGRTGEAASVLTKQYALDNIISPMARANHLNNRIYIHDLDAYAVGSHNCLSIPFDDLLAKGFNTRQTDVRPAGSINTAFQLVAVIFQLQSLQQFGGVSATHIDWTMVPYVRKSFYKHYMYEYYKTLDSFYDMDFLALTDEDFDNWCDAHTDKFLKQTGLTKEDFTFDNIGKLDKKLAQSAMYETRKETYQAVEGMYHNLKLLGRLNSNVKNIAI